MVLGASMGGLLAGRVLADHFEHVTIVERDELPPIGESRRGVPQGRHIHGLMSRGTAVLEQLFPGLIDELVLDGALRGDPGFRGRWINDGHAVCRVVTGHEGVLLSRPRLEGHVRQRVLSLANVLALEGFSALGLIAAEGGGSVAGVRIQRARPDSGEEILTADLVVDATGRGSQSPQWLEQLGYKRPTEERVEVGLRYMTRHYRRLPEHLNGDRFIVLGAKVPSGRAAFMEAIEGLQWIVTLQSYFGERLPSEDEGFREFASSLGAPDLADLLAVAEPCSDAVPFSYPANQRRRYDRMRRFPAGYLAFGDTICSFNPVYGQGMTVAAIEATLLDECLRSGGPAGLARRFFHASAKPIDAAWAIAVGNDLRFPRVKGRRPPAVRFANWYMGHVFKAAAADPVVARALIEVINLETFPSSLMHPGITCRVLWRSLRGQRAERDEMREAMWASVRDVLRDVERSGSLAGVTPR